MNLKSIYERVFCSSGWRVAYRYIDQKEKKGALPAVGQKYQYHVVEMPKGYWAADPFLLTHKGETYLFIEYTDMKKKKAVLAQKRMLPTESEVEIIYEFPGHTSYPCVFEHRGKLYMIPETGANNTVELFQCDVWPNRWSKKCNLVENMATADCTPFVYNHQLWIAIYQIQKKSKKRILLIGKLDVERGVVSELREAVVYDDILGRPGGHFIYSENGDVVRVVQPGNHYYGEKLEFYRVVIDELGNYSEEKIGQFEPNQIQLDKKYDFIGTHTFNRENNIEVIDVLLNKHFNILRPFKTCLQMMGIFGYGCYDRDRKYRDQSWMNK